MNSEVMQTPQLSLGRLLLLGASSLVLCISFIMSIFAPFPLALAVIMYGRTKGYLIGLLGLITSFILASLIYGDLTLFGFYFCVLIFGFGIAEIVIRGFSPVKAMVVFGISFILILSGSLAGVLKSFNLTPKNFILQQLQLSADKIAEQKKIVEMSGDKNSLEVLQLLDRPDLLADQLLELFPSYFFMGVYIMLWFNMFLVLKSRRLLFSGQDYPFSEKDLLNFKVPFGFVAILVIGLVFAVWGEELGSVFYEKMGFTLIRCLGLFYFFQGFGVFSDLLNFVGIAGFFRSLIVMVTIFMASYLIAAAGLFDNWFDFRKYFVKRTTKD